MSNSTLYQNQQYIICIMLSYGDTEINLLSFCWVKFWLLLVQANETLSFSIHTRSCTLLSKLHFNFATKVAHRVLLFVISQPLPSLLTCSLDTRHWNFLPPNSTWSVFCPSVSDVELNMCVLLHFMSTATLALQTLLQQMHNTFIFAGYQSMTHQLSQIQHKADRK